MLADKKHVPTALENNPLVQIINTCVLKQLGMCLMWLLTFFYLAPNSAALADPTMTEAYAITP